MLWLFGFSHREQCIPLCKGLPISNNESTLICFVDEDLLLSIGKSSKLSGFVPMMYKALCWEEQAGLSTVCSSHEAGYSIFMFFLVVVQQAEKVFKQVVELLDRCTLFTALKVNLVNETFIQYAE